MKGTKVYCLYTVGADYYSYPELYAVYENQSDAIKMGEILLNADRDTAEKMLRDNRDGLLPHSLDVYDFDVVEQTIQ